MINMMKVLKNNNYMQYVPFHQTNHKLDYIKHDYSPHFKHIKFLVHEDEDH